MPNIILGTGVHCDTDKLSEAELKQVNHGDITPLYKHADYSDVDKLLSLIDFDKMNKEQIKNFIKILIVLR